jgi:hypothetical protein
MFVSNKSDFCKGIVGAMGAGVMALVMSLNLYP